MKSVARNYRKAVKRYMRKVGGECAQMARTNFIRSTVKQWHDHKLARRRY